MARLKVLEAHRKERGNLTFLSEEAIQSLSVSEEIPEKDYRINLLEGCIADLPPTMKRAVELRYQGDHKPGEIASMIGWTSEAVYVALSRARSLLRTCIERKTLEAGETP